LELFERRGEHDTSSTIDLILLDVMMPGISGYEVCRQLREKYTVSQLPILFLTAKSQLVDLAESYAAGGNDFLTKPIAKEELFARIKTQLQLLHIHRRIEKEVDLRTTQLKESYNELNRTHDDLKLTQSQLVQAEKMSSLGTLVAGVGHEINNPISYIRLANHQSNQGLREFQEFLYTLLEDDADSEMKIEFDRHFESIYECVSTVSSGTDRLGGIVGNLQTFARGSGANKDTDDVSLCQVSVGLLSTLQLVKFNYKYSVNFDCDIQYDPEINCTPSELNQVFMNLMVNACQAMVGADPKPPEDAGELIHNLNIGMEQGENELHVVFTDNGSGMSQETIERVFEPFYTTKPAGEGTGLGMAISYGIIERHKGRIEIESELGKGSTLRVVLPL
ncbi:MAG: hypothetical protein COA42_10685, partial [Alteromonadaceae bacterium]